MTNGQESINNLQKKIQSLFNLKDVLGEEKVNEEVRKLEKQIQELSIETCGGEETIGDVDTGDVSFIGRDQNLATLADRSVIVGGDANYLLVITGDGNRVVLSPEQVAPEDILKAYYQSLAKECCHLPLGVVDPNFVTPLEQDKVSLKNVYTDLHVVFDLKKPEDEKDVYGRGMRLARGEGGERTELMKVIGDEKTRLLALVGDPGSGKTTLTNYLTYLLIEAYFTCHDSTLPKNLRGLLPIRLVLRNAARHLEASHGTTGMLWDAVQSEIASHIGEAAATFVLPFLQRQVAQTGALFLLDGLDEVSDADRRRKCLLEAVQELSLHLEARSRILLTARPYAYADPKWRLSTFELCALAPFNEDQVNRFVRRWYCAVRQVMGWDEQMARQRSNRLVQGFEQKSYLADLASRPLLLTLMTTLDSSWGKLPEDRADLYEESVKLLLSRWQRGREVWNEKGEPDWEPSITKALGVGEGVIRSALEKLAYETHLRQSLQKQQADDSADIPRDELLGLFSGLLPENVNPELILHYLETRSGLLLGRRENVYAFPHRSFQEYLAACYLATTEQDFAMKLREMVYADPDWWREVFLLGVGKKRLGGLGGAVELVNVLLPGEVDYVKTKIELDWRAAVLAGQALIEIRLNERAPSQIVYQEIIARVCRWLVRIVEDGLLTPAQRLEAGDLLGVLGDPRFDSTCLGLPAFFRGQLEPLLGFVCIPAGKFIMGSDENDKQANENEKPTRSLELPEFYIARYPVTNGQYRFFIDAGGYEIKSYWSDEGWRWRNGSNFDISGIHEKEIQKLYMEMLEKRPVGKRNLPYYWNHPQWGAASRPVIGISWYEAQAYSKWLDFQLKERGKKYLEVGNNEQRSFWSGFVEGRFCVNLPTEAQWEKAARGEKGLRWPWGNKWKEDRANTEEVNLKQTSPVGMFPSGASSFHLLDISGNTWEWTIDLFGNQSKYPNQKSNEHGDISETIFYVLRGGSWLFNRGKARCAVRSGAIPDRFRRLIGFRVVVT